MAFETLYMQIIDEDGVEVWPLSTIDKESSGFSKMISTSEMDAGKTYTVRISTSRKLRPIGESQFMIKRDLLHPGLLIPGKSLIPHLLLSVAESTVLEKVTSHIVEPEAPTLKIAWLVWVTQKDSRVCKYCIIYEGRRFKPNDPNLPQIPVHLKCRCHFDIITEEDEREIYNAMMLTHYYMEQNAAIDAYNIVQAVELARWLPARISSTSSRGKSCLAAPGKYRREAREHSRLRCKLPRLPKQQAASLSCCGGTASL